MALRYSCKAAAVVQGGTTFTHGLTSGAIGAAAAPDEWSVNLRGPSPAAAVLYVSGSPGSTSIIVAASGADGTCDVFCAVNHSIIE